MPSFEMLMPSLRPALVQAGECVGALQQLQRHWHVPGVDFGWVGDRSCSGPGCALDPDAVVLVLVATRFKRRPVLSQGRVLPIHEGVEDEIREAIANRDIRNCLPIRSPSGVRCSLGAEEQSGRSFAPGPNVPMAGKQDWPVRYVAVGQGGGRATVGKRRQRER